MANAVLAWRNWCAEVGSIESTLGDFEADAPLTNLLTPRTSELAIATTVGQRNFRIRFDGWDDSPSVGRPLGIFALLNTNIVGSVGGSFNVIITDADGTVGALNTFDAVVVTGAFQSHIFIAVDTDFFPNIDYDRIIEIIVSVQPGLETGTLDPYTGILTPEPFQAGAVWAGPIWRPTNGIKFGAFGQGITENLRGATSIGGQFYPAPQPRQRTSGFDFTLLSEPEVYSVDPDQPSLQQLGSWCARSRPLIVIPADDNDELVYAQGMYGYLTADPQWQQTEAAQTADVATKGRVYSGGLQMREAL
jgi:hypothetical protein